MEYLDLYDENKNITKKRVLRGEDIKKYDGLRIYIVIVFIENSKGEFLIQKTSKEKGNIFATTGGYVQSGSNCKETVIQEIKEELGISISSSLIKYVCTQKYDYAFQDVYYLKKDINIDDLTLQKEEVEYVKWLTIDEIYELMVQEKFRKSNIKAFKKALLFRRTLRYK